METTSDLQCFVVKSLGEVPLATTSMDGIPVVPLMVPQLFIYRPLGPKKVWGCARGHLCTNPVAANEVVRFRVTLVSIGKGLRRSNKVGCGRPGTGMNHG